MDLKKDMPRPLRVERPDVFISGSSPNKLIETGGIFNNIK